MSLLEKSWEDKQKRVFTKWVNYHLGKRGLAIDQIETGFHDGVNLINLYEQISGEKLGKYTKDPKMRVHKIANLNAVLPVINAFVGSVGIKTQYSAEQVTDGDVRSILGMTWCLIHKFAIQEISEEELSAREGLLLWCQKVTKDYKPRVNVQNFYSSWEDGMAFAAIIHKHRPDLIDYDALLNEPRETVLQTAIDVAADKLGIPRLLEASDFDNISKSDEKSVMTYVAYYWKTFASSKKAEIAGKRIGAFADRQQKNAEMAAEYERRAAELSKWIKDKTAQYDTTEFGNSLPDVQGNYDSFQGYKTGEKVDKTAEKTALEALLSSLITKQKAEKSVVYTPQVTLAEITDLWDNLGNVENTYDSGIREALRRQKYLDALLRKFRAKQAQLQAWTQQKENFLDSDATVDSVTAAQSKLKILDSYDAEYTAQQKSFSAERTLGQEIVDAGHSESQSVVEAMEALDRGCQTLAEKAAARRERLEKDLSYLIFREQHTALDSWITEKLQYLESDPAIDSIASAQAQIKLLESFTYEFQGSATDFDRVKKSGAVVIEKGHEKSDEVQELLQKLDQDHVRLGELAATRKSNLERELNYQRFVAQDSELTQWLQTKEEFLNSEPVVDTLQDVQARLREQDSFDIDANVISPVFDSCYAVGQKVIDAQHPQTEAVTQSIETLRSRREAALKLADARRVRFEMELNYQSFTTESAELQAWIDAKLEFLNQEIAVDSVSAVQSLQRELSLFDAEFASQGKKFADIAELRDKLVSAGHAKSDDINGIVDGFTANRTKLEELSKERNAKLETEFFYQTFLVASAELQTWVDAKLEFVNQEIAVDSIAAVKSLQSEMARFNTEFVSNGKKFTDIAELRDKIAAGSHAQTETVNTTVEGFNTNRTKIEELAKERSAKLDTEFEYQTFRVRTATLQSWIADKKAFLESEFTIESVASANANLKTLEAYEAEAASQAKRFSEVAELGEKVVAASHGQSDSIKSTLEDFNNQRAALEELAKERKAKLEQALAQQTLLQEFREKVDELNGWCDQKEAWLKRDVAVDSINAAQSQLRGLDAYDSEYTAMNANFESANQVASQVEDQSLVTPALETLAQRRAQLEELSRNRRQSLDEDIARRQAIDGKLLDFAKQADDFSMWADESADFLGEAVFAASVQDVERLEQETATIEEAISGKEAAVAQLQALSDELTEAGATENPYARFTIAEVTAKFDNVKALLGTKKESLVQERATQEHNATIVDEFDQKAREFVAWVEAQKTEIEADVPGTLEEQVAALRQRSTDLQNDGQERLNGVIELNNRLAEAKVAENASLNVTMLQVQFENLMKLVSQKIQVIEDRILQEKASDVSAEQLSEYRQAFEHFDKNKDNSMERLEFKACLASLGQDLDDAEIDAVIKQIDKDGDGKINLDEFVDYMSSKVKTSDSYEDVIDSFKTIAGDKEFITEADLRAALDREKAESLIKSMPRSELNPDAFDYKKFVEANFSK